MILNFIKILNLNNNVDNIQNTKYKFKKTKMQNINWILKKIQNSKCTIYLWYYPINNSRHRSKRCPKRKANPTTEHQKKKQWRTWIRTCPGKIKFINHLNHSTIPLFYAELKPITINNEYSLNNISFIYLENKNKDLNKVQIQL